MDTVNHFFTRATATHARLEYGLGFLVCFFLMLINWNELNVWRAITLFAYIDLIGTIPGLWAYRQSRNGNISKVYYVMYNVLHSGITQGLLIMTYIGWIGWEWAILAIPAHLCADRSIFNNYPKPFGLAFDPVLHPAFKKFQEDYNAVKSTEIDWKATKGNSSRVVTH